MDQGDDLVNKKDIQALLAYHRYTPRPTGGDASWQNDPGERSQLTIGYQLTTMLHSANLSFKLWPWSFNHSLLLHNMVLTVIGVFPSLGLEAHGLTLLKSARLVVKYLCAHQESNPASLSCM
jgi:hypothetical protein